MEQNAELVPDILSSPEVAGKLGCTSTFIESSQKATVKEGISDFADRMQDIATEAESYPELLERIINLSHDVGFKEEVEADTNDTNQPHIGFTFLGVCMEFLDDLDELSETENHDPISDFVDKLHQQERLGEASSLLFLYFASNDEFLYKYGNTFQRELQRIVDDLEELSEAEDPDPEWLIEVYRPWGSLCETALPPVLAVLLFLFEGEVNFKKAEEMNFKDSVSKIREEPSLRPIGERLHVDLRNSLSHGGTAGGYRPNPITEEITFWFERDGEEEQLTMSVDEFQEYVIETLSAVIALFVLPLYTVSSHACIEIVSVDRVQTE